MSLLSTKNSGKMTLLRTRNNEHMRVVSTRNNGQNDDAKAQETMQMMPLSTRIMKKMILLKHKNNGK